MMFWMLLGIDLLAASVGLFFFAVGVADGSVSAANFGPWMALLGGLTGIPAAGAWLRARGQALLGGIVLALLALPALGGLLLMLLLMVDPPHWQ